MIKLVVTIREDSAKQAEIIAKILESINEYDADIKPK